LPFFQYIGTALAIPIPMNFETPREVKHQVPLPDEIGEPKRGKKMKLKGKKERKKLLDKEDLEKELNLKKFYRSKITYI